MAASLLSVTFRDAFGSEGTFSVHVQAALTEANADLLAMIQAWRNLTQAELVKASLTKSVDISGLTNAAAASAGAYDRIRDQAIFQAKREDATGLTRMTVPAPLDAVFEPSGAFAQQDVDGDAGIVQAFRDAALDEQATVTAGEIWVTPQDTALDWDKGWRKGQPHS